MSKAILDALKGMAAAYPRQNVTPETIRVYLDRLSDLPEPVVVAAIHQAIDTHTFFPTVAELRGIIAESANGADDLAESAWAEVEREARRVGYNRRRWDYERGEAYVEKPQFSSKRIAEAVESVGWRDICLGESQKARTDFIFAYRNIRKRDVQRVQRGSFDALDTAIGTGDTPALDGGAA